MQVQDQLEIKPKNGNSSKPLLAPVRVLNLYAGIKHENTNLDTRFELV